MKVFLDTNIVLDLLLQRPGYEDSARILELQEQGRICTCASVLTMVNAAYIYRKSVGGTMAVVNLKYLSAFLEVLPMDNNMLQKAIAMEGPDFEDLFQAECASANSCDVIITRNTKDFKGLNAQTPAEFLSSFKV
jgi:predicted nucleic acid-binding protein